VRVYPQTLRERKEMKGEERKAKRGEKRQGEKRRRNGEAGCKMERGKIKG